MQMSTDRVRHVWGVRGGAEDPHPELSVSSAPTRIRLLICDDHRMLTDALALVLSSSPDVELVAEPVSTGDDAIALAAEQRPDVVLIDVHLGLPPNGIEATRRIRQVAPGTRVVVMTGDTSDQRLLEAVEAGAVGFLRKTEAVERALDVVRIVAHGETAIDPWQLPGLLQAAASERASAFEAMRRLSALTPREREILSHLRDGSRNDRIAAALFISPRTVETHVQNILRKLGVHSKLEAVAFAARYAT